jgi:dCMP deaminase
MMPGRPQTESASVSVCNVYVDGYNFYYSISKRKQPELLELGWCDFCALSDILVSRAFPGAKVGVVKYFTAPVRDLEINPGEAQRQQLWLDALRWGARGKVCVIEGYYAQHDDKPRVEKQTDTNLAISLVRDAIMPAVDPRGRWYTGRDPFSPCDGALIISGDSDFLPAAKMVAHYGRPVAVFRPIGNEDRRSPSYQNICWHDVTRENLHASQLPEEIAGPDGARYTWSRYLELKEASSNSSTAQDRDYLAKCQAEAAKSLDRDTQVGCIIVGPRREIRARGHNTLPRGVRGAPADRLVRPAKYTWIEHAERNAIYDAAKNGIPLRGCTMYVNLMPCADCARGIIQSGIQEVVVSRERMQSYSNSAYREQHIVAEELLGEGGVKLRIA